MPRDTWSQLDAFIASAIVESTASCLSGSLKPDSYAACCRRISTLEEIRAKMKELVGNPNAPGEDV
jgi:predicted metalloendopeptidase